MRDELDAVIGLAAQRVRVIANEIHAPIVYPGSQHLPYLSLPGTARRFALLSASKGWNLAGLKAAVAVAGAEAAFELRIRLSRSAAVRAISAWSPRRRAPRRAGSARQPARRNALEPAPCLAGSSPTGSLDQIPRTSGDLSRMAGLRALGAGRRPGRGVPGARWLAVNSGPPSGTGGAGHVRVNFATSPGSSRRRLRGWPRPSAAGAVAPARGRIRRRPGRGPPGTSTPSSTGQLRLRLTGQEPIAGTADAGAGVSGDAPISTIFVSPLEPLQGRRRATCACPVGRRRAGFLGGRTADDQRANLVSDVNHLYSRGARGSRSGGSASSPRPGTLTSPRSRPAELTGDRTGLRELGQTWRARRCATTQLIDAATM